MKLTKALNIAIPVDRDDGSVAWTHAMPISEETFDAFFLVLTMTYTEVFSRGLGAMVGASIAGRMLKRCATQLGEWDGVQQSLLPEIRRLANVAVPQAPWSAAVAATETAPEAPRLPAAWQMIPLEQAIKAEVLSPDEAKEVENVLVFFTCVSWVPLRSDRPTAVGALAGYFMGRAISSNCTEFAASLPTSTATASSGAKAAPSPIPS